MKTLRTLLIVLLITLPAFADDGDVIICSKDIEIGECPLPPPDMPVQTREPTLVVIVATVPPNPQVRMPAFTGIHGLIAR
jgi:hypothetical protein